MKKLLFAIALVLITAAFEQKAAMVYRTKAKPIEDVTKSLDTLANKMKTLKSLSQNEK